MTASIWWVFLTVKVELKVIPVRDISTQSISISLIHIINPNLYPKNNSKSMIKQNEVNDIKYGQTNQRKYNKSID